MKRILLILLAIMILPILSCADTEQADYSAWLWFTRDEQAPETTGEGVVLWYETEHRQSFRQDLLPDSMLPADETDVKFVMIAREGGSLHHGVYSNGADALRRSVDIIVYSAGTGVEMTRKTVYGGNPPEETTSSGPWVFGSWPEDQQIAEAAAALCEEISALDESAYSAWEYVVRTEEDIPDILAEYQSTEEETLEMLVFDPGVEILGYNGYAGGVLQIPATIDGLPVTAIGSWAFKGKDGFSAIVLPDSVTRLGEYAFSGIGFCQLELSDRITVIPACALDGVFSETIHLPSNLKAIAAFGCAGMIQIYGELELPEGLEYIGTHAFDSCIEVTIMTIPRSVKSIEFDSFTGCGNLTLHIYRDSYAYSFFAENGVEEAIAAYAKTMKIKPEEIDWLTLPQYIVID